MKCLETGEEISIDADDQMDTMSLIKIESPTRNIVMSVFTASG